MAMNVKINKIPLKNEASSVHEAFYEQSWCGFNFFSLNDWSNYFYGLIPPKLKLALDGCDSLPSSLDSFIAQSSEQNIFMQIDMNFHTWLRQERENKQTRCD